LAGGHTIDSSDPIFGLAVTGTVAVEHLKKNNGAHPGDLLLLTKPVVTGLLSTALKRGLLQELHYATLIKQMTTLNNIGEALGKMKGVHAMTDVTGFGILGHATEMAEGSKVSIELHYSRLPKMEGVAHYIQQRTIPGATARNRNSYSANVQYEKDVNETEALQLLPDPQTNGGLLIAVAEEAVEEVKSLFSTDRLPIIGRCTERREKALYIYP
ncbi:MAG: selenide, water dikinase SelD, partial [Flavisolibacter sp.]|nr:selenide, water dikinase SelD [Flavisolibacter sp.]